MVPKLNGFTIFQQIVDLEQHALRGDPTRSALCKRGLHQAGSP
jgi:hypothetical protein